MAGQLPAGQCPAGGMARRYQVRIGQTLAGQDLPSRGSRADRPGARRRGAPLGLSGMREGLRAPGLAALQTSCRAEKEPA